MARKDSKLYLVVQKEKDDTLLVSRQHRKEWRFHAFIGDLFSSEGEAKELVEDLVKSKVIPNVKYNIRKS